MGAVAFADSIVEYTVGILTVYFFTKKLFDLKSAKLYFAVSGTILFLMIAAFLFLDGEWERGLVVNLEFLGLMLTPFLLKGPKKFYIFGTAITISSVIMFVVFLIGLIFSLFEKGITQSVYFEFTGMTTSLLVSFVFVVLCTVLKTQTKFFIESISKPIVLLLNLFLIIGGNFCYIVSLLDSSVKFASAIKVLAMLISLIITIAFPVLIYNQVKKNLYRYETGVYEQQLNTQREYGKTIAQSGAQLRRFRHDYNNLSMYIKPLIEQGKSEEALRLVERSDKVIISSYNILCNTGNDTADAILTERQKRLANDIKIKFSGSLCKLPEDNFDICVLLNNTIDIALFSFQSINSDREKIIDISADCKQGVMLYKISFPCVNDDIFEDSQSNKDGALKINILKKLIEKNDGLIGTYIENQVASVTVRYIFQQ